MHIIIQLTYVHRVISLEQLYLLIYCTAIGTRKLLAVNEVKITMILNLEIKNCV